jgi:hypothetical protein
LCAYHAALAEEVGSEAVASGDHLKRRNPPHRVPVVAESEPLELGARPPASPSAVRPALALTAAEEVETIRRVLLEAATSTTRETWASCSCPECGKSFRQEISVPDHGARIKAVETLLREGLGRPAQAEEVAAPKLPTNAEEVLRMSWNDQLHLAALLCAHEIESVLAQGGREALRQRLAEFSDALRQVLSETLAELAHA